MRPTRAEVNLKNISYNLNSLKGCIKNGVKICPVVKANSYGHGLVEVAKHIENESDFLAVAITEEGVTLRESGIKKPIIVMGGFYEKEAEIIVHHNLIPFVSSFHQIEHLKKYLINSEKDIEVFIKFDTGMGRLGFFPEEFDEVMNQILGNNFIKLKGIASHFSYSDLSNEEVINRQLKLFDQLSKSLLSPGMNNLKIDKLIFTIANSAGTMLIKNSHYDMVRPGLSIYGLNPCRDISLPVKLKPALSLKTELISVKKFPEGRGISYSHTFITRRESLIGVIPVGYGDGFWRQESNRGEVLIKGKRCPVVGNVCMDLSMVDITDVEKPLVGDEVTIIGKNGNEEITVDEVADRLGTISYEVVTRISERVRRFYIK